MTTYLGTATNSPATPGVKGITSFDNANGVRAESSSFAGALGAANTGAGTAIYASSNTGVAISAASTSNISIEGTSAATTAIRGNSTSSIGVTGVSSSSAGVYGLSTSGYGVYAENTTSTGNAALYVTSLSNFYAARVFNTAVAGNGLSVSVSSGNTAINTTGNVNVSGNLSKTTGTFLIDHPLDPANKFLRHSFMESPEMKNFYDGLATANDAGEIEIALPSYFDALNESVRYQLTPLGTAAPNLHVKQTLKDGKFVVAGANKGQQVCWSVTGNRKDAYAKAHPIVVEEDKPAREKGKYRHPLEHGQPAELAISWEEPAKTPQA